MGWRLNTHGHDVADSIPLMLGIESSCDDTSIAHDRGNVFLAQFTAAQHIHAKYGGVFRNSRPGPTNGTSCRSSRGQLEQAGAPWTTSRGGLHARGPGLHGSLLVGSAFARSLAWARNLSECGPSTHAGIRARPLACGCPAAGGPTRPSPYPAVSPRWWTCAVPGSWRSSGPRWTMRQGRRSKGGQDDSASRTRAVRTRRPPCPGGRPRCLRVCAPRMDGLDFDSADSRRRPPDPRKGRRRSMEREVARRCVRSRNGPS